MKLSYLHKILITIIGIILLTSIFQIFRERIIEACQYGNNMFCFDGMVRPLIRAVDEATNFFNGLPQMIVNEMKKAVITPIENSFKAIMDPFVKTLNMMKDMFTKDLPDIFNNLKLGSDKAGEGIKAEIVGFFNEVGGGFNDIFTFIGLFRYVFSYIGTFFKTYIGSRINCGVDKIANIRFCSFYYFLDLIGHTLYLIIIKFPVWLIKIITGLDLQPAVDKCFEAIDCFDEFIYGMGGYHVIHYSDEVMGKCYLCKNLHDIPSFPSKIFDDQAKKISTDFNSIPEKLKKNEVYFQDAKGYFNAAFTRGHYTPTPFKIDLPPVDVPLPPPANISNQALLDSTNKTNESIQAASKTAEKSLENAANTINNVFCSLFGC